LFTPDAAGGSSRWLLSFPLPGGLLVLFSIQLLYHKFIRPGEPLRRGSPTKEVTPATRHDTLEDDGDDYNIYGVKTGRLLIGAVQDQALSGCFVSHLGVFRASFGLLLRERFSYRTPLDSLGPLLVAWVPPAPV
jgi:hypothetical protein